MTPLPVVSVVIPETVIPLAYQAENPRYHSMLVPLRQRMAEERRSHLSQHEDISFFLHGKDRKGERYGLEDTR